MPLTDEIFVQDIYQSLKSEGLIQEPSKSFFGSMLPSTNVRNTTIFVKGKFGVGIGALGITNKSTNQADSLSINKEFVNNNGVPRPTKLLFKGMGDVYNLDGYTDNKGTIVSEIQSQLLTTQVDNVKNPTAVLMNINMQTLNIVDYLVRRNINPESIILLLNQPLIKNYLVAQKQNESLFNKNSDAEVSKKILIATVLDKFGYDSNTLPDPYEVTPTKPQLELTDSKMRAAAKAGKVDEDQLNYFSYFLELQDQARTFSDFQSTQNSDTKGLKDRQMLEETLVQRARVSGAQIISPEEVARLDTQGVISPFYQLGRKSYSIFDQFYSLASSSFGDMLFNFKNKAAIVAPSADKDRVRQTIENDFMLFLVHNFILNKSEFDRLMKGDSVAKRILALKTKLPSNLVLKAFFPMLNNSVDLTDNARVDNLRLFEKELNSLDSNDLRLSLEEIAETDIDLYNDVVKLLMFQTGLNISPFNYRSVIPVGLNSNRNEFNEYQYLYADLLKEAVTKMNKEFGRFDPAKATPLFEKFVTLFAANNPQFLRKHQSYLWNNPDYPYTLGKSYSRELKRYILKPQKGSETQVQLGNAYMKQYFLEGINPHLFGKPKTQAPQKQVGAKVTDETTEVASTNTVTTNYVFTPDKITSLKPNEIFVFGSNTQGRHGAGAAKTAMSFGAKYGQPEGLQGQSYAVITKDLTKPKDEQLKSVPLEKIGKGLQDMVLFAKTHPEKTFLVTKLGSSLAGYSVEEIAGLFKKLEKFIPDNVILPQEYDPRWQTVIELDQSQSQSNYSPSLKMYEGFIQLNQLYKGDEILPFIGESEYYRYLVPMLLKMNPEVTTVFISNMHEVALKLLNREQQDDVVKRGKLPNGISVPHLNANLINFSNSVTSRTVVHELVHRTLQKEYEKNGEFKQKIDDLFSYAWDRQMSDGTYGFTNPKEFLAEALANPDFMEELNEIPYKEETVWSYLMTLVSDFINNLLSVELKSDSVLAEVVRLSEQVLNNNLSELSKESKVELSSMQAEIISNWSNYFPQYEWMNEAQKQMTARLAEEGKITLTCKI